MKLKEGQRQQQDGSAEKVGVDMGNMLEQDEGGDAIERAGEILQQSDNVDHFEVLFGSPNNSTPKTAQVQRTRC